MVKNCSLARQRVHAPHTEERLGLFSSVHVKPAPRSGGLGDVDSICAGRFDAGIDKIRCHAWACVCMSLCQLLRKGCLCEMRRALGGCERVCSYVPPILGILVVSGPK